ncbi:MAG: site-2 protease family protein [Clostridiaceae bacterium]|nr:site-2 protease family protein [Clostridiaceae bacterium]
MIPALLFAITFHEFSHGYVADRLGDPTPRNYGRLTLNPLKHLDPLGTIALLFLRFGWAKPVPINPMNFRDVKKGTALVGLAGPLSNIFLAFCSLMVGQVLEIIVQPTHYPFIGVIRYLSNFLEYMLVFNIGLAVFNIIPVPPLDGSKIFASVLPSKWYYNLMRYESYGQVILLILLFTGALRPVLNVLWAVVYIALSMAVSFIFKFIVS